eukprot:gene633-228_t
MASKMEGIQFPGTKRSTTIFGKQLLSAATEVIDFQLAASVMHESHWRGNFGDYFMDLTKAMASHTTKMEDVANVGLDYLLDHLEFHRDGEVCLLRDAIDGATFAVRQLQTLLIIGEGKPLLRTTAGSIPVRGGHVSSRVVNEWVRQGLLEPGVADKIAGMPVDSVKNVLKGQHFVIFGSGADLAPTRFLLEAGATVYAIQTNKPEKLRELADFAHASPGELVIPFRGDVSSDMRHGGVNLLTDLPEIVQWIEAAIPRGEKVTVGNYVYLEGEAHVRVTGAVYAISEYLRTKFHFSDLSFAFLGTANMPTIVPKQAGAAAQRRFGSFFSFLYNSICGYQSSIETVIDKDSHDGNELYIYNGVLPLQGPNHCLAKTLQLWSAIRFRSWGHTVSHNVAPACLRSSMCSSKLAEQGLLGMYMFPPCRAFRPDTASRVMAWLLAADLRDANSADNEDVRHPVEPFMKNSFHGGTWRCGFIPEDTGHVSTFVGKIFPQNNL